MDEKSLYFQFCPVAFGAEIFAERWTPLLLRELLCGSRRFSDFRRGLPRMSPALLTQRLRSLQDAGLIVRTASAKSRGGAEYRLTPAGEELRPVVLGLGAWAYKWLQRSLSTVHLDATVLMWNIRRGMVTDRFPRSPFVLAFCFHDAPREHRRSWLVWDKGELDLCYHHPGKPEDVFITTDLRTMTLIWLGDLTCAAAIRSGALQLEGLPAVRKTFPTLLKLSVFASSQRMQGPITQAAL